MTKLERLEKALEVAIGRLKHVEGFIAGGVRESITEDIYKINAILTPPAEFETVEVVRWAKMAPTADGWHGSTSSEEQAKAWEARNPGCKAVKMTGTFQRAKPQKVERSVSIEISQGGTTWLLDGAFALELIGKKGVFVYEEDAQ